MKKSALVLAGLAVASIATAQPNVPSGLTGLWRFQNSANYGAATFGNPITFNTAYGGLLLGPWTDIGTTWQYNTVYSDGSAFQEQSFNYMSVNPGFTANGGGSYVNQYTIAFDYRQTQLTALWNGDYYNSVFQTAYGGNDNDGDLFIKGPTFADSVIGVGDTGYSAATFDSSQWHRYVLSVDNNSYFRVYIDGTLYLDAPGQGVDGRFALYPDRFNLFADNDWEDAWGLVGTVLTWDHTLSGAEIAGMGGWIGGASTPTPLLIPEPATLSLLALGGLLLVRRIRR